MRSSPSQPTPINNKRRKPKAAPSFMPTPDLFIPSRLAPRRHRSAKLARKEGVVFGAFLEGIALRLLLQFLILVTVRIGNQSRGYGRRGLYTGTLKYGTVQELSSQRFEATRGPAKKTRSSEGKVGRRSEETGEKPTQKRKMPEEGVEPTRPCDQRILSPPRLPFRHSGVATANGAIDELVYHMGLDARARKRLRGIQRCHGRATWGQM